MRQIGGLARACLSTCRGSAENDVVDERDYLPMHFGCLLLARVRRKVVCGAPDGRGGEQQFRPFRANREMDRPLKVKAELGERRSFAGWAPLGAVVRA